MKKALMGTWDADAKFSLSLVVIRYSAIPPFPVMPRGQKTFWWGHRQYKGSTRVVKKENYILITKLKT